MGFIEIETPGYRFLIYPEKYYDGIDKAIEKTSPKMDVASLPDDSGYYYSTLYGLDNIRIPIIYSFLPQLLNLRFLSEKSLTELVNTVEYYRRRMGILMKEETEENKTIEAIEKLGKIEELIFRCMITRAVIKELASNRYSDPKGLVYFAGVLRHSEEQKLRDLGNGKAIYLSKEIRKKLGISDEDKLRVKVVGDNILIEKA